MVKGSVTISIEDYHAFVDTAINYQEKGSKTELLIKELQVFLSYMVTRTEIEPYVVEFNKQSKTSSIELNNGIAKIKIK